MDEIYELQRRLAEVQEQSTSNKFSDRVIVDLVNKIIEDYKIQLLYSSDGQEYMTPEHLDEQIYQLIRERGRVQLIDIPTILNVTLDIVESRVPKLVKKNKKDLIKLENEILTSNFLNQVCEEINEDLQQRSQITLTEITQKYNFTMAFLKEQLEARIESGIIEGNILAGEKICTLTFQELLRAKFRGLLRGVTKPLPLSALAKEYQIDQKLLQQIVEDLLTHDEIEGKIIGGSFNPARFQKNQENIIRNFFKQNSYIEYSMLSKQLFIQKPEETLKLMFKDQVILLDDCAFYKDSLEQLQHQIINLLIEEDKIKVQVFVNLKKGYTDLSFMFPTILSEADIETIVNKHLKLTEVELDETFIFSHNFIDKCVTGLKAKIIGVLQENPEKTIQQDKHAGDEDSDDEENNGRRKKGCKGGKKPAESSCASARIEGKKTKGQKQGQKKQIAEESKENGLFSQKEFIQYLVELGIVKKEDKDEVFECKLFRCAQPSLTKYTELLRREMLEKKRSGQSEAIQQLTQILEEAMTCGQLALQSIEQIEQAHSDINVNVLCENLHYALRLLMENCIVLICKKLAISLPQGLFLKKDEDDASKNISIGTCILRKVFKNKEMLQQAISLLPKEYSTVLMRGLEFYLKKEPRPLLEHFLQNNSLMGVRGVVDKKMEKNFTLMTKYFLRDLIRKDKTEHISNFQRITLYLLLDRVGMTFVGNLTNYLFNTLAIIFTKYSHKSDEITTVYAQTLRLYKLLALDHKHGANITHLKLATHHIDPTIPIEFTHPIHAIHPIDVTHQSHHLHQEQEDKPTPDQIFTQFESSLHELIKLAKL